MPEQPPEPRVRRLPDSALCASSSMPYRRSRTTRSKNRAAVLKSGWPVLSSRSKALPYLKRVRITRCSMFLEAEALGKIGPGLLGKTSPDQLRDCARKCGAIDRRAGSSGLSKIAPPPSDEGSQLSRRVCVRASVRRQPV